MWVVLTPLVTTGVSVGLFLWLVDQDVGTPIGLPVSCTVLGCTMYWPYAPTIFALTVPGFFNLTPFLWLASQKTEVGTAGIIAGLLGLLQVLNPAISMMSTHIFDGPAGATYVGFAAGGAELFMSWLILGTSAWLGSLLAWWIFGRVRIQTTGPVRKYFDRALGGLGVVTTGSGYTFGVLIVLD